MPWVRVYRNMFWVDAAWGIVTTLIGFVVGSLVTGALMTCFRPDPLVQECPQATVEENLIKTTILL